MCQPIPSKSVTSTNECQAAPWAAPVATHIPCCPICLQKAAPHAGVQRGEPLPPACHTVTENQCRFSSQAIRVPGFHDIFFCDLNDDLEPGDARTCLSHLCIPGVSTLSPHSWHSVRLSILNAMTRAHLSPRLFPLLSHI